MQLPSAHVRKATHRATTIAKLSRAEEKLHALAIGSFCHTAAMNYCAASSDTRIPVYKNVMTTVNIVVIPLSGARRARDRAYQRHR